MNVVDSSGWIEYFADEENGDFLSVVVGVHVFTSSNRGCHAARRRRARPVLRI